MKKTLVIISSALILTLYSFKVNTEFLQSNSGKAPVVLINNFKTILKEGFVINCRKIDDLGVIMYFDEEMKKYDIFQVELHRFGGKEDALVAFKLFTPASKEFQKMYAQLDSVKLKLLTQEDEFNRSDFELNSLIFKTKYDLPNLICDMKNKQHFDFYLVVKGYHRTGKKNKFGVDEYDKGIELSQKSSTFKNWENKTQ